MVSGFPTFFSRSVIIAPALKCLPAGTISLQYTHKAFNAASINLPPLADASSHLFSPNSSTHPLKCFTAAVTCLAANASFSRSPTSLGLTATGLLILRYTWRRLQLVRIFLDVFVMILLTPSSEMLRPHERHPEL